MQLPQGAVMEIRIEPTNNMDTVKMVITHPQIYPYVTDDGSPPVEEYEPSANAAHLLVWCGSDLLGLFVLVPQNSVTVEVHTCLMPIARGERAAAAAKELIRWVWSNTTFKRLVTNVPGYNRLALRFALAAGMTKYGTNTRSYMKNGVLWDQIMLGLSCQS